MDFKVLYDKIAADLTRCFKIKAIPFGVAGQESKIALQIWDTYNPRRFSYMSIVVSHYRGAHAILVCYSVDDPES